MKTHKAPSVEGGHAQRAEGKPGLQLEDPVRAIANFRAMTKLGVNIMEVKYYQLTIFSLVGQDAVCISRSFSCFSFSLQSFTILISLDLRLK